MAVLMPRHSKINRDWIPFVWESGKIGGIQIVIFNRVVRGLELAERQTWINGWLTASLKTKIMKKNRERKKKTNKGRKKEEEEEEMYFAAIQSCLEFTVINHLSSPYPPLPIPWFPHPWPSNRSLLVKMITVPRPRRAKQHWRYFE